MNQKILIVVQCRYNSNRLPGKALYPIAGIPMVAFLLRRLLDSLPQDRYAIVLATSKKPEDNVIAAWGMAEQVRVIRGAENDILGRYIDCLEQFQAETVVRVTADNPLTCPLTLQRLVHEKEERKVDYVDCDNLPRGAGTDVYTAKLLVNLNQTLTAADEREHINLHVLRNTSKFKIYHQHITGRLARPDLCMTVDTPEDYRRVTALFKPEEIESWKITLAQAIKRMDKKPV